MGSRAPERATRRPDHERAGTPPCWRALTGGAARRGANTRASAGVPRDKCSSARAHIASAAYTSGARLVGAPSTTADGAYWFLIAARRAVSCDTVAAYVGLATTFVIWKGSTSRS